MRITAEYEIRPRKDHRGVDLISDALPFGRLWYAGPDAIGAMRERREIWIGEEKSAVPCPIYVRDRLRPGNAFVGPAVVEQMDATTFVLPGMRARVDAYSNMILEAP